MDVTPLIRADSKIIQSYKGGVFKVSNEIYERSIIVMVDRVIEWAPSTPPQLLDFAVLEPFKDRIHVFLFGTGDKQFMLSPALRQQIKNTYGFVVDTMDNGAACRTYNVLMAEGRLVAVGLLR